MGDRKKSFAVIVLLLFIGYAVVYLVNQSHPNITSHVALVPPMGQDFKVARSWQGAPMYGYQGYVSGKRAQSLT